MAQKAGYTAVVSHRSGETKVQQLLILLLLQTLVKLKLVHYHVLTVLLNTISYLRIQDELFETAKYDGIKSFYNLDR
ncbi:hypothetical protein ACVPOQ_13035 [Staphylococcus aureus]